MIHKILFFSVFAFTAKFCLSQNVYNPRSNGNFFNENQVGSMVYADDVFSGKVAPGRKGDILYNIIDNITGDIVSYKKVVSYANGSGLDNLKMIDFYKSTPGDSRIVAKDDGILVRKYGSEYFMLTKDRLSVKDFGAKGDGLTDDYVALQKAINVCSHWGRDLHVPAGKYLFSKKLNLPGTYILNTEFDGNIDLNNSFNGWFTIKLIGDGMNSTELKYVGTTGNICVEALNGAGNICGGGLYDLTISGNKKITTALHIMGRGGFQTFHCKFVNHKIAILLHNSGGEFTEFVVQHDATFHNCETVLEYLRDPNGQKSFHGSGIDGGLANVYDNYPIKIMGNCTPYNAPLSLTMFLVNSPAVPIITAIHNDLGDANPNFYGHLSFENMYHTNVSNDASKYNIVSDGQYIVTYVGTISSYNYMNPGNLRQTNMFIAGGGGTPLLSAPNPRTNKFIYPAKKIEITRSITNGNNSTGAQLIFVSCFAQGFAYQALLGISDFAAGSPGTVKVIQVFSNTSTIGFNAPIITLDGSTSIHIIGKKADNVTPWDKDVNVQLNILPMSEAFTSKGDNIYTDQ